MEKLKMLVSEVARITEKLYKLQKIDIPQFFTDSFATVQATLTTCLVIFAVLLVVQAIITCLKKDFKRAAVLGGTALVAVAVCFVLVPHITALGAWIWTF